MITLSDDLINARWQKCWGCILDPYLLLSLYGVSLVQRLNSFMELWIERELLHIFDNPDVYMQWYENICPSLANPLLSKATSTEFQERTQALKDWIAFRRTTDLQHLKLFWLGDRLSESFLPDHIDSQIIHRWEALASSLDSLLDTDLSSDPIQPAYRDAIALSAVLETSFILSYHSSGSETNTCPDFCKFIQQCGISCEQISPNDPVVKIEQQLLLQTMIFAGVGKYFWRGLKLAVIHIVGPFVSNHKDFYSFIADSQEKFPLFDLSSGILEDCNVQKNQTLEMNIWHRAQSYWYWL